MSCDNSHRARLGALGLLAVLADYRQIDAFKFPFHHTDSGQGWITDAIMFQRADIFTGSATGTFGEVDNKYFFHEMLSLRSIFVKRIPRDIK